MNTIIWYFIITRVVTAIGILIIEYYEQGTLDKLQPDDAVFAFLPIMNEFIIIASLFTLFAFHWHKPFVWLAKAIIWIAQTLLYPFMTILPKKDKETEP